MLFRLLPLILIFVLLSGEQALVLLAPLPLILAVLEASARLREGLVVRVRPTLA